MRIAIPCDGDQIALSFGSTSNYKFYQIENNVVTRAYTLPSGTTDIIASADFLKLAGVQILICGGIGGAAIKALDQRDIMFIGGIVGNADERIQEFIAGTLKVQPIGSHSHCGSCHSHEVGEDCNGCDHEGNEGCTGCNHS